MPSNLGDMLFNAMSGRDPNQMLKNWSAQQTALNAAAINPNAPPGSVIPGAMSPQDAAALGPTAGAPPQEAQAYKTPADLGSLLMDLRQRESADQGLNQALGLGFAAFAQPRDREMVSKVFNQAPDDPQKVGDMLLNAQSQVQNQARNNALLQMANTKEGREKLATQLNTTPEAIQALALSGKLADAINTQVTPTPDVANLAQIERYVSGVQQKGASPEALQMIRNSMIAKVAGPVAEKAVGDAMAYKARTGKDAPWVSKGVVDEQAYNQWSANNKELNDSVAEGQKDLKVVPTLIAMQRKIQDIKNDPALDTMLSSPLKRQEAQKILDADPNEAWSVVLKTVLPNGVAALAPEELRLIANIRQLNGQEYTQAFHSLNLTRPAASEIAATQRGIGQTRFISEMDPKAYREQALDELDDNLKSVIGNSFGHAQTLKDMPDEYRPYVSTQYLKGGARALDNNGSEDWADAIKPTAAEIKDAQDAIDAGESRGWVEAQMRRHGLRPEGLHDRRSK